MSIGLHDVGSALRTKCVGRRLLYLETTGSTMDVARGEAEEGAAEGTVVFAEEQTAGRGRFGRAWVSPAGKNLYFTLVLRPDVERLRRLSMIMPLAVCLGIEETTGLVPRIKWPNDVLLSGRKVSGILIESEFSGEEPRYALIGIGVNVNFEIDPSSEIAAIATSVKQELGRDASRELLLAAVLNQIERMYEAPEPVSVHGAWKSRLQTLGREVRVTFRGEVFEGLAEDVDAGGSLVLRTRDGSRRVFEAGEVSLRG